MSRKTKEILTTKGEVILIDSVDFGIVSKYKWNINSRGYAVTSSGKKKGLSKALKMHRSIMGVTNPKDQIDHINRNKIDNTRCNLRICSNTHNSYNRSGNKNSITNYKGVKLENNKLNPYSARIIFDKKYIYLGAHKTAEIAAMVYNVQARIHFGEFAYINKIYNHGT